MKLSVVLVLVGLACVTAGLFMLSIEVGLIAGGLCLTLVGLLRDVRA